MSKKTKVIKEEIEIKEENQIIEAPIEIKEEKKKKLFFDRNVFHSGKEFKKGDEFNGKDFELLKDYLV